MPPNFGHCSVEFRYMLGGTPLKVAAGHPRRLRDDFATIFDRFGSPLGDPGGALWGSFWCMFLETDLRDTEKGGPGARFKLDTLFGGFGGLPAGPQEGSLLHDSSIFTFAAGAKKGSKI